MGGSWVFDGIDDYIEIADSSALQSLTTNATWWAWYKRTTTAEASWYGAILHKNNTTSAPWVSYGFGRNDGSANNFFAQRGSGTNYAGTGAVIAADDVWVFIAATYDSSGSELKLRLWSAAGSLLYTETVTATGSITYTAGQPLRLGRNEGTAYLKGKIAYAGAHNQVLSDTDLSTIRTTGVPPITPSAFFTPLDSSTASDTAQSGSLTVYGATFDANDGPPVSSATVPAAISNLSGTPGDGQFVLTWTAPNDGGSAITDYAVQWRVAP